MIILLVIVNIKKHSFMLSIIYVHLYQYRLGRSGALTDHSSVLFDVGIYTGKNEKGQAIKGQLGEIQRGMTNAHWYKLGPMKAYSCPWLPEVCMCL
jgi:hypothetical protein